MSDAYTDEARRERGAQRWIEARKARREAQVRSVVLDLVRHSGLNAIAQECHRLAVARGKYTQGWDLWTGYTQLDNELEEWWDAAQCGDADGEIEEMGDLLHAVLSIAHHRGIDVEAVLRRAMQRNAERAREGV